MAVSVVALLSVLALASADLYSLTAVDIHGKNVSLSQYRGKVVFDDVLSPSDTLLHFSQHASLSSTQAIFIRKYWHSRLRL